MGEWMNGQIVNSTDKPLLFESPEASEVKQTATVFVRLQPTFRNNAEAKLLSKSKGKNMTRRPTFCCLTKYSQVRDTENWCYFTFFLMI